MDEKQKLYRTLNDILTFCFKCLKVAVALFVICTILIIVFGN
ncbi:Uncharacterised protein [Klebsiella pneumoniae]|nr:Uncharacterised protein [Klebsiella pneumoniae]SXB80670.1 Uncharacterised protein [Klebsiella pneumoniae]SXB95762.1 Uncharacterised protein [Klebsiella pneumoniae]